MSEESHKIKIKRSDGTHQWVTEDELDEINLKRKQKAQNHSSSEQTRKAFNRVIIGLTIIGLMVFFWEVLTEGIIDDEPVKNIAPIIDTKESSSSDNHSIDSSFVPTQLTAEVGIQQKTEDQEFDSSSAEVDELNVAWDESELKHWVVAWAQDWSSGNVEAYISRYVKNYRGSYGSYEQWRETRSKRINDSDGIHIELENLQLQLIDTDNVEVEFRQIYTSTDYQDVMTKRLFIIRVENDWKITSEAAIPD